MKRENKIIAIAAVVFCSGLAIGSFVGFRVHKSDGKPTADSLPMIGIPGFLGGSNQKNPKADWSAVGAVAKCGEVEVKVESASMRLIERTILEFSDEPLKYLDEESGKHLHISVLTVNRSDRRKIDPFQFNGWHGQRDMAQVEDEIGNQYKLTSPTLESRRFPAETLYPGKSTTTLLIFEPPVAAAEELRISIPGGAFGSDEPIRLRIMVP